MTRENALLGEYKHFRVTETDSVSRSFAPYNDEISAVWGKFKESHPNAKDAPKIRVNLYEEEGDTLILYLSRGISFANIIHSNMLCTQRNLPHTPEETYDLKDGAYHAIYPFSNAAAVAGVVLFDPNRSYDVHDPDIKTVLSVRSRKAPTNPGSLGLLVNGYVEIRDDEEINEPFLLKNLLRKMNKSYLTGSEISEIELIGLSQTRGKSSDLTWLVRTDLPYGEWEKRWLREGDEKESRGVVPISICNIQHTLDGEIRKKMLLEQGVLSKDLRDELNQGDVALHPFFEAIYPVLANELHNYLTIMKK